MSRMFSRLAASTIVVLALVSSACGGDDTESTDTSPRSTPTSASKQPTPTAAQLEAFSKQAVPGFTASDARVIPIGATVTYTSEAKNAAGAQVVVLVQVSACDAFTCASLDPATYSSAEAQRNLKSVLPSAHIENPALRWDFGALKLSPSATGLYTYGLSYLETKDASGGTTRTSANSYRAWYHDGRILMTMQVFSRGGSSVRSLADLEKEMTRAEAEAAAIKVFAALSPNFAAK